MSDYSIDRPSKKNSKTRHNREGGIFNDFLNTKMRKPYSQVKKTIQDQDYERLVDNYYQYDEPMAEIVGMMDRLPAGQGRGLFFQAVDDGIDTIEDAPEELIRFFAHVDEVQKSFDQDRIKRGTKAYKKLVVGWPFTIGAFHTLVIANVTPNIMRGTNIVGTGKMDPQQALRRNAVTLKFIYDAISPGGLERYGVGFTGALKARLVHAILRDMAHNKKKKPWDTEYLGALASSSDTYFTLLCVSMSVYFFCDALGYKMKAEKLSKTDLDDIAYWLYYVSVLSGSSRDLPQDWDGAMKWWVMEVETQREIYDPQDTLDFLEGIETVLNDLHHKIDNKALAFLLSKIDANFVLEGMFRYTLGNDLVDKDLKLKGGKIIAPILPVISRSLLKCWEIKEFFRRHDDSRYDRRFQYMYEVFIPKLLSEHENADYGATIST